MPAIASAVLILSLLGAGDEPADLVAKDLFGRTLNGRGLVLVDWEGQMANPAVRFEVHPPADAALPARVVLRAKEPRLYFDLPSEAGPGGPRKELLFKDRGKATVSLAIFPDRDPHDEDHALELQSVDANGRRTALTLPVHVVDQDPREWRSLFPIAVDFSKDRTRFFRDEAHRAVIARAAEDWVYFFDDMRLQPVPAAAERTFLWDDDGFKTGRYITNEKPYTGFLLYAYGIRGELLRSGGEPSRAGGYQAVGDRSLPLRRSGGVEVEVQGNYNTRGWLVPLDDADWWKATNLAGDRCDLYSIVHHEIGHALAFNPGHMRFGLAKLAGRLRDPRVSAYLGADPAIDRSDHLHGTVDPESLRGAFGHEYHGRVPRGRWLITKTDLLCAQAIGYALRSTSAFAPLRIRTEELHEGSVAARYSAPLRASGGIPFYHWEVVGGALPAGLELDPFSGEIRGLPSQTGTFAFTVRVRDYAERAAGQTRKFTISVRSP